jgi:hypothetical protein
MMASNLGGPGSYRGIRRLSAEIYMWREKKKARMRFDTQVLTAQRLQPQNIHLTVGDNHTGFRSHYSLVVWLFDVLLGEEGKVHIYIHMHRVGDLNQR